MSDLEETRRLGVEQTGIEIIDEADRTARPGDLFWPWFAANVSVFGMSYAGFILYFGISFWQGVLVAVVGIVVSFALCGVIAIAGKRGSAPTMVLSRAAFGVNGQKVPGVISWLVSIGWETFLAILAVLATSTIFDRLGWAAGTGTQVVATVVVAALIVAASVAGYHVIMRMQSVLTWITGIVTVALHRAHVDDIDWSAVAATPGRSEPGGDRRAGDGDDRLRPRLDQHRRRLVALPVARRLRRRRSSAWNTFGGALAPVPPRRLRAGAGRLVAAAARRHRGRPDRHPLHAAADVVPRAVPARRDPRRWSAARCSASTPPA